LKIMDRGGRIDLVFSDIVMPGGMSGRQLAQELAVHYPHVPVILATGHENLAASDKADLAGPPLLIKPFSMDVLAEAIFASMHRGPLH
ncbi:MAG: response regulator, partial [Hyphomicrobium sp.]